MAMLGWHDFHDRLLAILPSVDPTAQLADDRAAVDVRVDGMRGTRDRDIGAPSSRCTCPTGSPPSQAMRM